MRFYGGSLSPKSSSFAATGRGLRVFALPASRDAPPTSDHLAPEIL